MGLGENYAGAQARRVGVTPTPAELEEACEGFYRRHRRLSAKYVLSFAQIAALALIGSALIWAIREDPSLMAGIAYIASFALFAAFIALRLIAAANLDPAISRLYEPTHGRWPTYSILCPLHRESAVVFDLVGSLQRFDYPDME